MHIQHMVSSRDLGIEFNGSGGKSILTRMAAILAILPFFSARGTKIDHIMTHKAYDQFLTSARPAGVKGLKG